MTPIILPVTNTETGLNLSQDLLTSTKNYSKFNTSVSVQYNLCAF